MKCLVTGGAGFIGSHLVDRLLDDGHEVIILDNFSRGRDQNIQRYLSKGNVVAMADCEKMGDKAARFVGVDWVFHLAALADIVPSIAEPMAYHSANVDGTIAVLEASRHAGVKRFIYAASSSCYGIPDAYPTPETAPCRPRYPYALTKYIGEQYAMHWAQVYKLPVVSLRLFNVYGPRARTSGAYGAVMGTFLAQKFAGKPFTVVGDGTQGRDFIYVTDVVDAMIKAAESDVSGEAYNVGTGVAHSINELVGLIGGERVHLPRRPGEPDRTMADISKIEKAMQWQLRVPFRQGVTAMFGQIEEYRDAPVWTPESIAGATSEWFKHMGSE